MCFSVSKLCHLATTAFTRCEVMNCTARQKKNSLLYCVSESGSGSGSDSEQERPRSASNASGSGSDSERERDDDDEEGQEAGKPSMNKVCACVLLLIKQCGSKFCSVRVDNI